MFKLLNNHYYMSWAIGIKNIMASTTRLVGGDPKPLVGEIFIKYFVHQVHEAYIPWTTIWYIK